MVYPDKKLAEAILAKVQKHRPHQKWTIRDLPHGFHVTRQLHIDLSKTLAAAPGAAEQVDHVFSPELMAALEESANISKKKKKTASEELLDNLATLSAEKEEAPLGPWTGGVTSTIKSKGPSIQQIAKGAPFPKFENVGVTPPCEFSMGMTEEAKWHQKGQHVTGLPGKPSVVETKVAGLKIKKAQEMPLANYLMLAATTPASINYKFFLSSIDEGWIHIKYKGQNVSIGKSSVLAYTVATSKKLVHILLPNAYAQKKGFSF
jgi:hypothetical protein